MGDLDFDRDELLEQARGNSSAIWHLSARYAREREGSVDRWATNRPLGALRCSQR